MHDIEQLFCDVIDDVEKSGVSVGNIIDIKINNRFTRALGRCHRERRGEDWIYTIEIAKEMAQDNVSAQGLKNTIAHEILHTARNCFNHGAEWKRQANKLMAFCPEYEISRCTDARKYGMEERKKTYKHFYRCEKCGQLIKRQRASNFCQRYICGCGGHFKEVEC